MGDGGDLAPLGLSEFSDNHGIFQSLLMGEGEVNPHLVLGQHVLAAHI